LGGGAPRGPAEKCEERRREEVSHRKLGQTLYTRDRAYDNLEQAGFQVLPSEPDPDRKVVGPEKEAKAAGERAGTKVWTEEP
jgi:hypothetical protein